MSPQNPFLSELVREALFFSLFCYDLQSSFDERKQILAYDIGHVRCKSVNGKRNQSLFDLISKVIFMVKWNRINDE